MKQFLRYSGFFILPVILLLVMAELALRQLPNEYSFKKDYLDHHAKEIKILCLGSSHSFYNIDPAYFSMRAFNAGHSSQSLDYDWLLFDKYESKLDSLEYLLIPISYFSFAEQLHGTTDAYRQKNYFLYYNIKQPIPVKYYFEMLSLPPRKNFGRLYDFYVAGKKELPVSALGYGNSYSSAVKNDLDKAGEIAAAADTHPGDDFVASNISMLEKSIIKARDKNVQVILFTSPAWHSFADNFDKKQQAQADSIIKSIVKKYPGTLYSNYLTDQSFVAADFYDADHLNEKGAKKFTEKLNAEILSLQQTN